jgi:diguanylate cyclase (GGDEF)-like protein
MPYGDTVIRATTSIGIAQYHRAISRYEELIKEADDALYQAKNAGRNRVRCAHRASSPCAIANGAGI